MPCVKLPIGVPECGLPAAELEGEQLGSWISDSVKSVSGRTIFTGLASVTCFVFDCSLSRGL